MNQGEKILLTAGILLIDVLLFMLPITAFFAIYIIWAKPTWFYDWVRGLYESS